MKWTGNLTLRMGGKEDTYSPGSIQIKEYKSDPVALEFLSHDEQDGAAIARFNLEEWNNFVKEVLDFTRKLG